MQPRRNGAGPSGISGHFIVENVAIKDPGSRYPLVEGELVGSYSGDARYRWACEIPTGDDYLAAQLTSFTLVE